MKEAIKKIIEMEKALKEMKKTLKGVNKTDSNASGFMERELEKVSSRIKDLDKESKFF